MGVEIDASRFKRWAASLPPERRAAVRPRPKLGGVVERVRAKLLAGRVRPRRRGQASALRYN